MGITDYPFYSGQTPIVQVPLFGRPAGDYYTSPGGDLNPPPILPGF